MKKLKFSKALEAYCLVERRGNKIIRAGRRTKRFFGVYYPRPETITVKTMLFNGEMHTVKMDVPSGIRVYGPSKTLMGMELKKDKK